MLSRSWNVLVLEWRKALNTILPKRKYFFSRISCGTPHIGVSPGVRTNNFNFQEGRGRLNVKGYDAIAAGKWA